MRHARLRRLASLLPGLHPDLIVLTGDFIHNDAGLDAVESLLRLLPAAPLGCFAVLGNHDYVEYSWRQFFGRALRTIGDQRTSSARARTDDR